MEVKKWGFNYFFMTGLNVIKGMELMKLGRLEKIEDLRDVWPGEATHFFYFWPKSLSKVIILLNEVFFAKRMR